MDRDEVAARRLAAGQPQLAVNDGLVYLVPHGFEVLSYDDAAKLVASDGCEVRTIAAMGRVNRGK